MPISSFTTGWEMKDNCTRIIMTHIQPALQMKEPWFICSQNSKHTTFIEGMAFLRVCLKQNGHCVVPKLHPQKQQLAQHAKYICRKSLKLFTARTSKVML
jgi:hypothetical protein